MVPDCKFCSVKPDNGDAKSLELHLQYGHGISQHLQLALSVLMMGGEEVDQFILQIQPRLEEFRSSGSVSEYPMINFVEDIEIEDEDPKDVDDKDPIDNDDVQDIQNVLMTEQDLDISSDEEDDTDVEAFSEKESINDEENITHKFENDINIVETEENSTESELNKNDDTEMLLKEDHDSEYVESEDMKKPEDHDDTTNTGKMAINLVEKFATHNLCRLCYAKFPNVDSLRRHESIKHEDDRAELSLSSFTYEDLVHGCQMAGCHVKYLSQNLLNAHMEQSHQIKRKKEKKLLKKKGNFVCKLCYKNFTYLIYLNAHIDIFWAINSSAFEE